MRLVCLSPIDTTQDVADALRLQATHVVLTHRRVVPTDPQDAAWLKPTFEALAPALYLDPSLVVLVSVGQHPVRDALRAIAEVVDERGCGDLRVAAVTGSDFRGELPRLVAEGRAPACDVPALAAYVPLGAGPIVDALSEGARIVLCDHAAPGSLALAVWQQADPVAAHDWQALTGRAALGVAIEAATATAPRWVLAAGEPSHIETTDERAIDLASGALGDAPLTLPDVTLDPLTIEWNWSPEVGLQACASVAGRRSEQHELHIALQLGYEQQAIESPTNRVLSFNAADLNALEVQVNQARRQALASGHTLSLTAPRPLVEYVVTKISADMVNWDVQVQTARKWL